jgi:type IX secretion system PorP/SprF family membrane protein
VFISYTSMLQTSTRLLLFLGFLCGAATADAQDPRFSQYFASPWTMNPAMTGVFNGGWRVTANYRDQWNSFLNPEPFRTYSVAVDMRKAVNKRDFAAFGIGILRDEAGTAQFVQNRAHVGGSFIKQMGITDGKRGRNKTTHYLAVGAQVGVGQNAVDWSKLWFSRQFDPTTDRPNTGLSSGEANGNRATALFPDLNAGLLWYSIAKNGSFFYAGGAMQHLNQPDISFRDGPNSGENLYLRWSAHAGGQVTINKFFSILPGVQAMKQGPAFETNAGMNVRYSHGDRNELALRAGVWGRLGNKLDKGFISDAFTVVSMLEMERMTLGLSYDVTVSSLTGANNSRGAFELSVSYFHPAKKKLRVLCPRF